MTERHDPDGSIQFRPFSLDTRTGQLRRGARSVRLSPQPFKVLSVLLARPGALVTREELRQEIWPADTFVDFDQGLNFCIRQIRTALGDTADTPTYIETLP